MAAFAGPTILGVETGNFGRGKAIIIPEVVPAIRRFAFYAFYTTGSGVTSPEVVSIDRKWPQIDRKWSQID